MTGMKQAIWAGVASVLLAAGVFKFNGPNSDSFSLIRSLLITSLVSLAVLFGVMFGPIGIFEVLFDSFRITKTG